MVFSHTLLIFSVAMQAKWVARKLALSICADSARTVAMHVLVDSSGQSSCVVYTAQSFFICSCFVLLVVFGHCMLLVFVFVVCCNKD